eukprot:403346144
MDLWLQLIIFALISLLFFAWYLGVFQSVKISEDTFHGGTFIYKDWQGHIKNVGVHFGDTMKDLNDFKKNEVRKFNLPMMAIYYDQPNNLKDSNKCRASVGMLLQFKSEKIPKFFQDRGYKIQKLPTVQALHGQFPCYIRLSCFIGALKFYTAVWRFTHANSAQYGQSMQKSKGAIELNEGGFIKYYFPIENQQEFNLTIHDDPELINPNLNKIQYTEQKKNL